MKRIAKYSELSWNHELWSLVRYYRSLRFRSKTKLGCWLKELRDNGALSDQSEKFPIKPEILDLLEEYVADSAELLKEALNLLRSEKEALSFCNKNKLYVGATNTKNKTHHQSSQALVAAVSGIAEKICSKAKSPVDLDPQRRAVWLSKNGLHVSARNLDGAIPSLENPSAIWEIKEYWGKTKGGSKMSDAVYECHLVGLELRTFEATSGISIDHIVFVDGKDQWACRKSDLMRFIDLHQQGLIDHLVIGSEVESDWPQLVRRLTTA